MPCCHASRGASESLTCRTSKPIEACTMRENERITTNSSITTSLPKVVSAAPQIAGAISK
jgi:hypothetical protein